VHSEGPNSASDTFPPANLSKPLAEFENRELVFQLNSEFLVCIVKVETPVIHHCKQIKNQKTSNTKTMEIIRVGSQASGKGPAEYFTGTVRIDPLFSPPDPARVAMALVTFEPGARTAWHTHPLGQTLIVTAGSGWAQRGGGQKESIKPGDIVWFPPGEKHWHGAADKTAMSHIAIQEKLNGSPVNWLEQVSDEQYGK
jgi:quercetin dioxygenase-like cupin family protein